MTPNDELAAILARVITEPDSDLNRLVYADRLEERGESGDADHAGFVRVQVELAKLSPRIRLEDSNGEGRVIHKNAGGPDYYDFIAIHDESERLKPGDRIDILKHRIGKTPRIAHGLRVVRVVDTGPTPHEYDIIIVCKDVNSVPWTGAELQKRQDALFNSGKANWTVPCPATGNYTVEWDRGFYGKIVMPAADFLKHADALIWHPEQTVPWTGCKGRGGFRDTGITGAHEWFKCYACEKGRVKREMPPLTAHPIRKVTITTASDFNAAESDAGRIYYIVAGDRVYLEPNEIGTGAKIVWEKRFPGIEFELLAR